MTRSRKKLPVGGEVSEEELMTVFLLPATVRRGRKPLFRRWRNEQGPGSSEASTFMDSQRRRNWWVDEAEVSRAINGLGIMNHLELTARRLDQLNKGFIRTMERQEADQLPVEALPVGAKDAFGNAALIALHAIHLHGSGDISDSLVVFHERPQREGHFLRGASDSKPYQIGGLRQ